MGKRKNNPASTYTSGAQMELEMDIEPVGELVVTVESFDEQIGNMLLHTNMTRRKGLHWITDRFQSTHPARGATAGSWPTTSPNANFNPRTPRGVRRHRRPGRP